MIRGFTLALIPLLCTSGGVAAAHNPWSVDLQQIEYRLQNNPSVDSIPNLLDRAVIHGKYAVRLLVTEVDHPAVAVRRRAVMLLAKLGPLAAAAEASLIDACDDRDDQVKKWAMTGLVRINGLGVDRVLLALGSDGQQNQALAREALFEKFGYRLHSPLFYRWIDALGSVHQKGVIGKLQELVRHRNPFIAAEAAAWLSEYGSKAKPALLTLVEALGKHDDRVVQGAAAAIGAMGRSAHAAKPNLEALLKHSRPVHRIAAAIALIKLGYRSLGMSALEAELEHSHDDVRSLAVRWIFKLADVDAGIKRKIFIIARDESKLPLKLLAFTLLSKFGYNDDAAQTYFLGLAGNDTVPVALRNAALFAAFQGAGSADRVIAPLKDLMIKTSLKTSIQHYKIYWHLSGSDSAPVVKSLLPYLNQSDPTVRLAVLDVLETIRDDVRFVAPYLVKRIIKQPIRNETQRQVYSRMVNLVLEMQSHRVVH